MTLYNLGAVGCFGVWLRHARLLAALVVVCSAALLHVLRTTVLTVLLILQPLVSFALSAIAVLGVLTALVIEASGAAEMFPFWGMMGLSLGCTMLVAVYHALVRFLSQ